MRKIVGFYGLEDDKKSVLQKMLQILGVEEKLVTDYFLKGSIGFGFMGGQAQVDNLSYQSKEILAVGLTEVYNRSELYENLSRREIASANQQSNLEFIAKNYLLTGEAFLDKLDGSFGVALYNSLEDELILARDHFGVQPLYYLNLGSQKKPVVLFSSDIKSLLQSELFLVKPNEKVLARYLRFRAHDDTAETFFEQIKKVQPGEMLVINSMGIKKKSFSKLESQFREQVFKNNFQKYNASVRQHYRQTLTSAIERRMEDGLNIGMALSGGLDSSVVTSVAQRTLIGSLKGRQAKVFSAVFPGEINDEEKYVDSWRQKFPRVKVNKVYPNEKGFWQEVTDFVRVQEEPTISTGPYAQYCVMKQASQKVEIMLDGQGADEVMAGYLPAYFVYFKQLWEQHRWGRLVVEVVSSLDIIFQLVRFKIFSALSFKKDLPSDNFLSSDFLKTNQATAFSKVTNNLRLRLVDDIFRDSLPALLRYEAKNTNRFNIKGRVPFLDKKLVELVFSLEDQAIIKRSWNKRILREAFGDVLPVEISRRRKKVGFSTPEVEWLKRLNKEVLTIFTSEKFASRPYFNQLAVVEAFKNYLVNKNSVSSMTFWRILNTELWLREFIDEPIAETEAQQVEFQPNEEKSLDIKVGKNSYRRLPIRTKVVQADDQLSSLVLDYLKNFAKQLNQRSLDYQAITKHGWMLFISEKIVAITQQRAYFIWDIKPRLLAKILSRFVTKSAYGIGLAHPCTMELAIREAGGLRILLASLGGILGKVIGKRGVFYNLAGHSVRAIDGPTAHSVYPANVSAKLSPEAPDKVAQDLTKILKDNLPKFLAESLQGVVIIDANDLGRNILGKNVAVKDETLEAVFADNPLGQARQQTPLAVVFRK